MVCLVPTVENVLNHSRTVCPNGNTSVVEPGTVAAHSKNKPRDHTSDSEHINMDFDCDDGLELRHLTGVDLVSHPPLFSPNEQFLFVLADKIIQVYSTTTGEFVRQLSGASSTLISMEIEVNNKHTIIGCTVKGEVLRWMWQTGQLKSERKLDIDLADSEVISFNLLNFYANSESACAFVITKQKAKHCQWQVVDTDTGNKVQVPCNNLFLKNKKPSVVAGNKHFKYIIVVQDFFIYFINYNNWQWTRLKNIHQVPVTCVRFHPTEELVATGDEVGKVFLWRHFMDKHTLKTSLYHWHHTAITSIAFSASGASFYSSGMESVLVRWNVARPELRDFLPRMNAIVRHIAVTSTNTKVAVCTVDNGIQILGNDSKVQSTVQEFTYIMDDKTGRSKFPVGMLLNPRSNTLVLNGRPGHLQFFSAYTKSLLYNMDVVAQNRVPVEADKILYNINVVKAAFNINWMATGEVFNDEEHLPELRLKFWSYNETLQSYSLNTNVEMPHEIGFKAIEFSSPKSEDPLYCATVGEDNVIKMWSVGESDNIYNKGLVWYCIGQTSYKNMPIESISFSQDGSLLAAGFGNTLCIYTTRSLKLTAALTSGPGFDGCVLKAQVRICNAKEKSSRENFFEQRQQIMQQFKNFVEKKDQTLIKVIQKSQKSIKGTSDTDPEFKTLEKLDDQQKEFLYNKIMQMHQLNLFQKVVLYQKLGIRCKVHEQWQTKVAAYLRGTVHPAGVQVKCGKLHAQLHRLNLRDRFKAKYRLQQYMQCKRNYDMEITRNLVPIMSVLNLSDNTKLPKGSNNKNNSVKNQADVQEASEAPNSEERPVTRALAAIKHVQFATGLYAHLVLVCTERRVLVWNVLTLRLQMVLKLSVDNFAFDAQTNLIAAFTRNNELYVFHVNEPISLYQRQHLPNVQAAAWLPHRYPKDRSLSVDWQANATLYFLTENQQISYLSTSDSSSSDAPPPITFANSPAQETQRYSTFGTFAIKQISEKQTSTPQHGGPLVVNNSGKNAVKSLIEMCSYTMPPLSLLCNDFLKALVTPAESAHKAAAGRAPTNGLSALTNGGNYKHKYAENGDVDMDSESDDDDAAVAAGRHSLREKREALRRMDAKISGKSKIKDLPDSDETLLKRIAAQKIDLVL